MESKGCCLCLGTGLNKSGIVMRVNNHICPRCGGYGTVPFPSENPDGLSRWDWHYAELNGVVAGEKND